MRGPLLIDGQSHEAMNPSCPNCWGDSWPRQCRCGGLVHAQFGDYTGSGDDYGFYLDKACDCCGANYDEVEL